MKKECKHDGVTTIYDNKDHYCFTCESYFTPLTMLDLQKQIEEGLERVEAMLDGAHSHLKFAPLEGAQIGVED